MRIGNNIEFQVNFVAPTGIGVNLRTKQLVDHDFVLSTLKFADVLTGNVIPA